MIAEPLQFIRLKTLPDSLPRGTIAVVGDKLYQDVGGEPRRIAALASELMPDTWPITLTLPVTVADGDSVTPQVTLTRGEAVWNWGDGTAATIGAAPNHTYVAAGTYAVQLTLTGGRGSVTDINFLNDAFSFDLGVLRPLTALRTLTLGSSSAASLLHGSVGSLAGLTGLTTVSINLAANVGGEVADLCELPKITSITTSLTGISATRAFAPSPTLAALKVHNNGLTEAEVGVIAQSLYAARARFVDDSPVLQIGGTNADPAGVSQAGCPPETDAERLYELANDSCGDGFTQWTVVL